MDKDFFATHGKHHPFVHFFYKIAFMIQFSASVPVLSAQGVIFMGN